MYLFHHNVPAHDDLSNCFSILGYIDEFRVSIFGWVDHPSVVRSYKAQTLPGDVF